MAKFAQYRGYLLIGVSLALVTGIGLVDSVTGYEVSFAPLYLIPVALATWYIGVWFGLLVAGGSAFMWLGAEIAAGLHYSHPAIYLWNSLMRLVTFGTMAVLLGRVRKEMALERELARQDPVTGAANPRHFREMFQKEAMRACRYKHPLTIGYIDLDNFKLVNDTHGHSTGDVVLRTIVEVLKDQLRQSDVVARMGGDEFALLLPEAGEIAARSVFVRVRERLQSKMDQGSWPVTFSIGVLVCEQMPDRQNLDDVIRRADSLMYSIKSNGKNGICFALYTNNVES